MKEIILGVWLGVQAGFDMKYKEVPSCLSIVGVVIGIGCCVVEKRAPIDFLLACLPGLLAVGFSWITKEIMGYGDGIILTVMGFFLPISQLISIGLLAFFMAGVVALGLLVLFHKNGRYRIPFIPFLGLAYGWDWLIRLGEL